MVNEEVVKRLIEETRKMITDLEELFMQNTKSESIVTRMRYTLGQINISIYILDELELTTRKEYTDMKKRYSNLFDKIMILV